MKFTKPNWDDLNVFFVISSLKKKGCSNADSAEILSFGSTLSRLWSKFNDI